MTSFALEEVQEWVPCCDANKCPVLGYICSKQANLVKG